MKNCLTTLVIILGIAFASNCESATKGEIVSSQNKIPGDKNSYLSEQDYLALPEEKIKIAEGLLIIEKKLNPDLNIKQYLKTIDNMADELNKKIKKGQTPEKKIKMLNDYLFGIKKFQPELNSHSHGWIGDNIRKGNFFFLSSVLDRKRGDCFGLSFLYLSLTEKLGLPIYGVVVPTHMFVRYDDGNVKINIETLQSGACVKDAEYITNKNIPKNSLDKTLYLKNLTKKQCLGIVTNKRGSFYFYVLRDYNKANQDFTSAVTFLELDPEYHFNLSTTLMAQEKYEEALDSLKKAIELNSNLWQAWGNLCKCYQEIGRYDEAIVCCSKAIDLSSHESKLYANRAFCYLKKNQYDNAVADYNKSLELSPELDIGFNNLAIAYASKGDLDEAIKTISRGIARQTGNAFYYYLRAMFYCDKDDFKFSIKDLKKAVELDPSLKNQIQSNPRFSKWRERKALQELFR